MDLFTLIFTLVFVGVVLFFVNKYVPMQPDIKRLLNLFVVIVVVLWLLFTVFGSVLPNIRVGG